jgi:sulfoxide reductase heme-binding subunit YedZ
MPFLREKTGRWSREKIVALAIGVAPALWMIWKIGAHDLGEKPVKTLVFISGHFAAWIMILTLLITPARRVLNRSKLANARRILGVTVACYGVLHLLLYIAHRNFDLAEVVSRIALRPHLTIGFIALTGLIALAVTSTDAAVRRLGQRWNALHKAAYAIGVLVVVHFAFQRKPEVFEPALMMGFLVWLLAYRALFAWRREVRPAGFIALAIFAALVSALFEAFWHGARSGIPVGKLLALNWTFAMGIRPMWWVLAAGLAVCAIDLAAARLRPKQPRQRFNPARGASA